MKILLLFFCIAALSGCAEFRDPATGHVVARTWGNFRYDHEYPVFGDDGLPVATGCVQMSREISTEEVIAEVVALVSAVGTALALVLPLL